MGLALGGKTLQAQIRSSRRQPAGDGCDHEKSRNHCPESRFRRGRGFAQRRGGNHSSESKRQHGGRFGAQRVADFLRAVSSGIIAGTARRALSISVASSTSWPNIEANDSMPKRTDIQSIMLIGSGPIVIGQACEFDYSGTQALKALKEEGYRVILINSNPATIMTDPGLRGPNLYRADHHRHCRKDHRQGTARRAVAHPGRANRVKSCHRARGARCSRTLRRRDDRRQAGVDQESRRPRSVQRRRCAAPVWICRAAAMPAACATPCAFSAGSSSR